MGVLLCFTAVQHAQNTRAASRYSMTTSISMSRVCGLKRRPWTSITCPKGKMKRKLFVCLLHWLKVLQLSQHSSFFQILRFWALLVYLYSMVTVETDGQPLSTWHLLHQVNYCTRVTVRLVGRREEARAFVIVRLNSTGLFPGKQYLPEQSHLGLNQQKYQ